MVSKQYIKICTEQGYKFPSPVKQGNKLSLGANYVFSSCELMMEVGLKLGQTLWRKLFPDELESADEHLKEVIYEFLTLERWGFAQVVGEYTINLKKYSKSKYYKLGIINYSIALKFDKKGKLLKKQLDSTDWSDSVFDFRLAESVLQDDYDTATKMMRRIGKESEYISEVAYYTWPLFKEFRNSTEFKETYESIYEHPFIDDLQQVARKTKEPIDEQMNRLQRNRKQLLGLEELDEEE